MVFDLARRTAEHMGTGLVIARDSVRANCDYVGDGYGVPTAGMVEAVKLLARTEGLVFDPVCGSPRVHGCCSRAGAGAPQQHWRRDLLQWALRRAPEPCRVAGLLGQGHGRPDRSGPRGLLRRHG